MYAKFMQISIRNHVGKCALLCFYTIFKRWHNSKCLVGEKKENNDSAGPLLLDGTYFGFISPARLLVTLLRSWRCWGERGRLIRAWPELPSWKAPLWLTPLSSLSSPLQLARWQVHVEKRDNQLPSPLVCLCPLLIFPVSLSHSALATSFLLLLIYWLFSLSFFHHLYLMWIHIVSS